MKWIEAIDNGTSASGKTRIWSIITKDGPDVLGTVKWFGRWRKYCWFPEEGTIYEEDCMRDIAAFIEEKTKEHREAKK